MKSLNEGAYQFIQEDAAETIQEILAVHEAITGRKLFPADPERLFLMSLANMIVHQRVLINQTARQNLLRYARGTLLDHMGEMTETKRLQAAPAVTTVEFTLSMPLNSATLIPKGTRIGPQGGGGALYFVTTEVVEIAPGQLKASASAECAVPGTAGNGFEPGILNVLVDPVPFVVSVRNTTESSGGSETESDDAYRERIRTAPESFSTAGPEGAYEYWAKSANPAIVDVGVYSPAEGEVVVLPLLRGGELPTADVLDAVKEAVNDRKVRPLTDRVTVQAPETVPYDIGLTYWVSRSRAADSAAIQAAVAQAVEGYRLWQKSRLGRDINPSELIGRVMAAGALRVNVASPVYTELSALKVAQDGKVNIVYGGLADD
ncbi:baseplate assembly protein [Paenibacillus chitinolyticus]